MKTNEGWKKEGSKREIRVKERKVIRKGGKRVKINWNSSKKGKKRKEKERKEMERKGEKMLRKQY